MMVDVEVIVVKTYGMELVDVVVVTAPRVVVTVVVGAMPVTVDVVAGLVTVVVSLTSSRYMYISLMDNTCNHSTTYSSSRNRREKQLASRLRRMQ